MRKRKSISIQIHCRFFRVESVAAASHCYKWFSKEGVDFDNLSGRAETRFWTRLRMHRLDLKKCLYPTRKKETSTKAWLKPAFAFGLVVFLELYQMV